MRHKKYVFLWILCAAAVLFPVLSAAMEEANIQRDDIDSVVDKTLDAIEKENNPPEAIEAHAQNSSQTKIIPVLHAEASSIIETLNEMKSAAGEISFNLKDRTLILKDAPDELKAMTAFVKEVDIPLETDIFKLKYVQARETVEEVRSVLTKSVGQVKLDNNTNSIIATDTPVKIGEIREMIQKLDRVDKDVVLETKILHIILNDEHMRGVDWEAIVSEYQNIKFSGFPSENKFKKDGHLNLGVVTSEDYAILLDALDTVGVVRTVSDEAIAAQGNTRRTINVRSSRDEKIYFDVDPTINPDGVLTVRLRPGADDPTSTAVNNDEALEAKLSVDDGSTIVIGSLFEEVVVESSWKIPLLGDLPLLGFVFRNQGEESRKAEMITFITVKTTVKNEGRQITEIRSPEENGMVPYEAQPADGEPI